MFYSLRIIGGFIHGGNIEQIVLMVLGVGIIWEVFIKGKWSRALGGEVTMEVF